MSYVSSGKKSSTPSILKKSNRPRLSLNNERTVRFQLSNDLKSVLQNYKDEKDKNSYVNFVCNIRDSAIDLKDDELLHLLKQAGECVSIIDDNLLLFVQVMMIIKWAHRREDVVKAYQDFMLHMCIVHCDYIKFAFQQFLTSFNEVNDNEQYLKTQCLPSVEEEKCFQNIHCIIKTLVEKIPLASSILLNVIEDKFPFKKASARSHLYYIHNILSISSYYPSLRRDILTLIFVKLVDVDVSVSNKDIIEAEEDINEDDIFKMEIDEPEDGIKDMKNVTAHTMDICLHRIYRYFYGECYDSEDMLDWAKTKEIYMDMLHIFDQILLPTHGSTHIQFTIFYIISFKDTLANGFINYLWKKTTKPEHPAIIRNAALSFLSDLLVRANYIPVKTVKDILSRLSVWIHEYIEKVPYKKINEMINVPVVKIHAVFYSACESLFYILTYRHSDLVSRRKNLKFVANLNIGKIVTSKFNPLAICSSTITDKFAEVMKTYQIAYCYTVIPFESRRFIPSEDLWIYEFFPFESYMLRRSFEIIEPLYRKCENQLDSCNAMKWENHDDTNEEDDFIPFGLSPHSPCSSLSQVKCSASS